MTAEKLLDRRAFLAGAALLAGAGVSHLLIPRNAVTLSTEQLDLQTLVPDSFAGWQPEPRIRLVEPDEPDSLAKQIYSQTVSRAYHDEHRNIVMLLIAYGPSQSEHLQLHRPELCYAAAGFTVSPPVRQGVTWRDGAVPLRVTRLMTRRENRIEPVTYWMRVGDGIATSNLEQQAIRLQYGFNGEIPDGALIRISSFTNDPDNAFTLHDAFIKQLFAAIDPSRLSLLTGSLNGQRRVALEQPTG